MAKPHFLGRLAIRLVAIAGLAAAPLAFADYPDRPIKLVVGFPPGGGGDLYGRIAAEYLGRRLGKTVVIENRGGAGGNLAADAVAKSKPDGYTLLVAMSSNISVAAAVHPESLPYKVPDDFVPIGMMVQAPHGLFAAEQGFKSAPEAFAAAKKRHLSYGSSGPGSVGYVTMEMIKRRAGVDITSVPYRGSGPAITDLMGGQTDLFFATAPPVMGQAKAGKIRLLALTGETRNPTLGNVPTFRELGIDVAVTQWYGIVAPAGTPASIVQTLSKALSDSLADPELRRRMGQDGAIVVDMPREKFREYILRDIALYRAGMDASLIEAMRQ